MPSGPSSVTRFCPANQWTQVEWYVGTITLTKRYAAPGGGLVRWRWFSAGIPPYWEGSFTGAACITLLPAVYVSLEMNPSVSTNVVISVGGC